LKKHNRLILIFLLAVSTLLTGCADAEHAVETQGSDTETLGLTPVFDYELPKERPNVLTDRIGYLKENKKTAVFQGEELPDSFRIIDKESKQCVYVGTVRVKKEDKENGLLTGQGNFTDFKEEGSYYIECDKIGCSYYFEIGKDIYFNTAEEFREILETAQEGYSGQGEIRYSGKGWRTDKEGNHDTVRACEAASYLLAGYEIYPDFYAEIWRPANMPGEDGEKAGRENFFKMIRRETDWLLSMQDEKTGGIYGGVTILQGMPEKTADETMEGDAEGKYRLQEINEEATFCFAGTMAKYGYLYQEYDREYANVCLKAAAKAWRYLERNPDRTNEGTAGRFYAASELYRASNEGRYHNYILQNRELILNQKRDFYLLMGEITYLSTKRKVNNDLCNQMMNLLMEDAEKITLTAKEGLFMVEEEEPEKILWNMTIMTVVNYAITNQEYSNVIEEHVHFLLGRNRQAEFLTEDMEIKDVSRVLMLLSAVMAEK